MGVDWAGIGARMMRAGEGVSNIALIASDWELSSSAIGMVSGVLARWGEGTEVGWRGSRRRTGRTFRPAVGEEAGEICRSGALLPPPWSNA